MTKARTLNQNELDALRLSVEGSIRKAFSHVRRSGGVSWSEADVIDDYGSAEERAKARLLDKDTEWTQLVDDRRWDPHNCTANFSFLDPIGRRYYMPAVMIRAMKNRNTENLRYHLDCPPDYLNEAQRRAAARYIYFMWQRTLFELREHGLPLDERDWSGLLTHRWKAFLNEPNR